MSTIVDEQAPLLVEHILTDDDANGPWPPVGDGWQVICSSDGKTTWRRIAANDSNNERNRKTEDQNHDR